jgi:hypothetical protein
MDPNEQAVKVAVAIEQARSGSSDGAAISITVRSSSQARLFGACTRCGYRFSGDVLIVQHPSYGRRSISERSLHYLGHGTTRHDTGHRLFGEPVFVEIEVEEWVRYLGLEQEA